MRETTNFNLILGTGLAAASQEHVSNTQFVLATARCTVHTSIDEDGNHGMRWDEDDGWISGYLDMHLEP